jgi:hypothetical protein
VVGGAVVVGAAVVGAAVVVGGRDVVVEDAMAAVVVGWEIVVAADVDGGRVVVGTISDSTAGISVNVLGGGSPSMALAITPISSRTPTIHGHRRFFRDDVAADGTGLTRCLGWAV